MHNLQDYFKMVDKINSLALSDRRHVLLKRRKVGDDEEWFKRWLESENMVSC